MIATIQHVYDFIIAITLGIARLYPCFILVPVFSLNVLKGMTRNAVVISLTLLPAPIVQQQLLLTPLSWPMLPGLLLKEIIVGLLIALILAMPFWLFESVGALFDNQRGALMGGQLNPALGSDATPLGHLLKQTLILLLIIGIGLNGLTQLIWDSYQIWPCCPGCPRRANKGLRSISVCWLTPSRIWWCTPGRWSRCCCCWNSALRYLACIARSFRCSSCLFQPNVWWEWHFSSSTCPYCNI